MNALRQRTLAVSSGARNDGGNPPRTHSRSIESGPVSAVRNGVNSW